VLLPRPVFFWVLFRLPHQIKHFSLTGSLPVADGTSSSITSNKKATNTIQIIFLYYRKEMMLTLKYTIAFLSATF
jgi:hypothetical protein